MELMTLWLKSGEPNTLLDFAADVLLMEVGALPWPGVRDGVQTTEEILRKVKNTFNCTTSEAELVTNYLPMDAEILEGVKNRIEAAKKGESQVQNVPAAKSNEEIAEESRRRDRSAFMDEV